ncbi:MAG: hypothetical protein AAF515_09415 [Pseudomonadota bacterium]
METLTSTTGEQTQLTAGASAATRTPWAVPVNRYLLAIIRRDWRAQLFATCGCATAALIACFQFCVFSSFIAVAYVVPQRLDADVWVMASGVSAFDFPHPIAEDYGAGLARFFPGATLRRIQVGFTTFGTATGRKSSMVAVGYDGFGAGRRSFVADRTDLDNLEASAGIPELGSVDFRRLIPDTGLAGFLGAPYLLMSLKDANAVLRQRVDRVSFLVFDLPGDSAVPADVLAAARGAYPELTIRTNAQFYRSTALYWLISTGAGAAVLLAAILASALMLLFLVSGITRFAQRYREDFLTMLGLGMRAGDLRAIVARAAVTIVVIAILAALCGLPLMAAIAYPMLPWVSPSLIDVAFALTLGGLSIAIALRFASREMARFDLAAVFRS